MIGVAAHISGAAPGGPRYRAELTSAQRRSIENGIWLCADHSVLVDRDERAYTEEVLRRMRDNHETTVARQLASRSASLGFAASADLVALGPNIIFLGRCLSAAEPDWKIKVEHFVRGDSRELVAFCSQFSQLAAIDRHILFGEFGDGRVLTAPPSWSAERGLEFTCHTEPRSARIRAQDLASDLKLDEETWDLDPNLEMISGVAALPQKIGIVLSSRKGEWFLDQGIGTRIAEYVTLFEGSPFLSQLVRLEVIRMASIPFFDASLGQHYTPLACVERVQGFRFLAQPRLGTQVEVEVDFVVNGVGPWKRVVRIHLPSGGNNEPFDEHAFVQQFAPTEPESIP